MKELLAIVDERLDACIARRLNVKDTDPAGECPIYLWDHDRPEQTKYVGESLFDALSVEYASVTAGVTC